MDLKRKEKHLNKEESESNDYHNFERKKEASIVYRML